MEALTESGLVSTTSVGFKEKQAVGQWMGLGTGVKPVCRVVE